MDKKQLMERTENVLHRHLDDLVSEAEKDGGIRKHMTLDGIKDVLKCLRYIGEMNGKDKAATVAKPAL